MIPSGSNKACHQVMNDKALSLRSLWKQIVMKETCSVPFLGRSSLSGASMYSYLGC